MDNTKATIRNYFAKLGLEAEIADMYLALYAHGPQTISALARNSRVERTRIYRLIGQLGESNLFEVESQGTRAIVKAAPIANLRILINQRQAELRNLQDELELVEQALARNSLSDAATRVQLYHGPEGIRQMLRNMLQADDEILSYYYQPLEPVVGKQFMTGWLADYKTRRLERRLVTQADSGIAAGQLPPARACRTVGNQSLAIRHGCDIYNGVVATYIWQDGEVYGTETYSSVVAVAQRQLFELLWVQAAQTI